MGPDAPRTDYVGLAGYAVLAGALLGAGTLAAVTWGVRMLQAAGPPPSDPREAIQTPAASLLLYGTGIALFLAWLTAFQLLRPVRSGYRQTGLGMVSVGATVLLGFLPWLADRLLGPMSLLPLAAAAGLAFIFVSRRIRARFPE